MHLQNETARLWQGERVSNVDLLAGVIDTEHSPFALQSQRLAERFGLTFATAAVVALHAFGAGRAA
jgi:uncharacterized membrane protein (UPF0136 family)